jgi:SAM-dependent methyltransferase
MMPQHGSSTVLDFLAKRGESSAAFFFPFLDRQMSLLDIGCGPGAITTVLAGRIRQATGIDIEPNAIERARRLAVERGIASLKFVAGDMTLLPFNDDEFDAVFAHGVLYHLDEATLTRTLEEARRVLRPGGVIGIRDSDTGGDILHPESKGLLKTLDLWMKWYGHADSDSVRFGRRQSAVLRAHGFTPIWTGASYVNHSADAAARSEAVADAQYSLNDLRHGLIGKGLTSDAEMDEAMAAWETWGRNPDSMYLRCRCECVARKDFVVSNAKQPGVLSV